MATITERLELLITGDARDAVMAMRQASGAAGTLDNGVAGATTQMSKMRAMAGAVGSHVQQNIGMYSVAAVGALTTAAIASIKEFTDLAEKVRGFSRASGLGAEQSSRLVAVFDDLKVSQETADKAFGKLSAGVQLGTANLAKYGVEVARQKNGNLDTYGTLLNIAEAYKTTSDQGFRAALGVEAFGKGWMAMAPILEKGRDGIREMYAAVPSGQILKDEDVMAARRYELAMDDLKDSVMELKVAAGNELVPTLTALATATASVVRFTGDAREGTDFWSKALQTLARSVYQTLNPFAPLQEAFTKLFGGDDKVDKLTEAQNKYGEAQKRVNELSDEGAQGTKRMRDAKDDLERAEQKVLDITERRTRAQQSAIDKDREALQTTYDLMLTKLGLEGAGISLERSILRYNEVNADSTSTDLEKRDALLNATQATMAYAKQQLDLEGLTTDTEAGQARFRDILNYIAGTLDPTNPLRQRILDYGNDLNNIPRDVTTRFNIRLNSDEVFAQLQDLGLNADQAAEMIRQSYAYMLPAGASGAIVNRPTMALIGEAGPEAVIPLSRVPGNQPLPTMGQAAGQSITIPLVVDGKVLAEVTASEFNRPGGPLIRQRVIV